jgi:hypothetical protein
MWKLICLLLSVGYWNQFDSVPKWSHLAASTVKNVTPYQPLCDYIRLYIRYSLFLIALIEN